MIFPSHIRKIAVIALFISSVFTYSGANASDSGLFRSMPVDTPEKGTLWVSNTSFYAPISVNSVLKTRYGVTDSNIFSSITTGALGITDRIALTGSIPFYADMYSQRGKRGEKTGPGDVSAGLRYAFRPKRKSLRGITLGASITIPEEMGYGDEPLGFRRFSTGEIAFRGDMAAGFRIKFIEGYFSASYRRFPSADNLKAASNTDVFYEGANGYVGIGVADATGLTNIIFQDHAAVTLGTVWPYRDWLAGVLEVSAARFTEAPKRETVLRLAPGIRFGRLSGIHASTGIDFRLSGDIPVRSYMLTVNIPFFRPKSLIPEIPSAGPEPRDLVRSRNSLVAVRDFTSSDISYLYEDDLKHAFLNKLKSLGIMDIVEQKRVDTAYAQRKIVPGDESSRRLGVRLGANYLINTDIAEYSMERGSSFSVPLLIAFPKTTFSLSASASVTDLVDGRTYDLGVITATIEKSRGVSWFSTGGSSDLVYLTEPERRRQEKELVDIWVGNFNDVILMNLDVFGWEPKRTEILGDEETSG